MGLLDGKVAIITGAGRGVGKAEAMAMVAEGAKVVINDLGGSMDGIGGASMVADEVVGEIKAAGGQAAANYSDVGTLEGVDNMIWTALNKFGRLDIMVHNAGILRDRTLLNMDETDWDLVQKVHAKGSFLCTRAAGRVMKAQGEGGVIMNTTSMSGLIGNFGQSNYSFAKAGMYGFTKTAAMELGAVRNSGACDMPQCVHPYDGQPAGAARRNRRDARPGHDGPSGRFPGFRPGQGSERPGDPGPRRNHRREGD